MKKFLTIILIIALVLLTTAILHTVNAESNWKVSATTNNETITEETKQIIIQLKLDNYSGNGELGYQANLSYDKNIFQSVSINAQNDWEDVEYEATTGGFISTTKNAKEGTVIAEIVLTLKDGITSQSTTVSLNDVIFSDADVEVEFDKTFTYTLQFNVSEDTETKPDTSDDNKPEQNQPNTETPDNNEQTPSTDNSNNTEKPNTNPDTSNDIENGKDENSTNKPEDQETSEENTNKDDTNNNKKPNQNEPEQDSEENNTNKGETNNIEKPNTNNTQTPNTNNNNATQTNYTTIKVDGATKEDVTTAGGKLPQTGGISTLVIIGIIAVFGIVCYIRYRTIQIK